MAPFTGWCRSSKTFRGATIQRAVVTPKTGIATTTVIQKKTSAMALLKPGKNPATAIEVNTTEITPVPITDAPHPGAKV